MHANVVSLEAALGRQLDDLVVTGGGASSPLFMQILADVFGVPVRRPQVTDAAGMGAAICAAVGAGMHDSWDNAIDAMVRSDALTQPDAERHREYRHWELRSKTVVDRAHQLFVGVD